MPKSPISKLGNNAEIFNIPTGNLKAGCHFAAKRVMPWACEVLRRNLYYHMKDISIPMRFAAFTYNMTAVLEVLALLSFRSSAKLNVGIL